MKPASTLLMLFLSLAVSSLADGPPPTPAAPNNVSSVGTIANSSEPGERLVVTGQVFAPDGQTLAADVTVYAYQTDTIGHYQNDPQTRVARLHGWAKTDSQGRFEFHTIRPGPYPGRSVAAHIHFHIYGGGYPLQWTPDLMFADDPLIRPDQLQSSAALGRFANIQTLTRDPDGTQRCNFNIHASKTTNYPAGTPTEPLRQ
jgi:protocatechuate 3,4-dioxygenase, beta subunit